MPKSKFLNKYNPTKDINVAISKAIGAAVQHNSLYVKHCSKKRKFEFKSYWIEELTTLGDKYTKVHSQEQFIADFLVMKDKFNEYFSDCFNNKIHPKYKYEPGFRVSHAQKSLSVYLKHLWCMNIIPTPPLCPIDRSILQGIGKRNIDSNWCFINSKEDYVIRINWIEEFIKGKHIAEWELANFN